MNVRRITNSIEFRDAVMDIQASGQDAFVRKEGTDGPVYRVIPLESHQSMTVVDLFERDTRPVHMEDMATAMIIAERTGRPVVLDVFTR